MTKPISFDEFKSIPKENPYFSDLVIEIINKNLREAAKSGMTLPVKMFTSDLKQVLRHHESESGIGSLKEDDLRLLSYRGVDLDKIIEVFSKCGWIVTKEYAPMSGYVLCFDRK